MNELITPQKKQDLHIVSKPRQMVLKTFFRNELRKTSLPLQVMKLRDYIFSEMSKSDQSYKVTLNVADYFSGMGITKPGGKDHDDLRKALEILRTTDTPIVTMNLETGDYRMQLISWIEDFSIFGNVNRSNPLAYELTLRENITREMQADQDKVNTPWENACRMKSKYGLILRDYLISNNIFNAPIKLPLEELAALLDAVDAFQKSFSDFRVNVVEAAIRDVNNNAKDVDVYQGPFYEKEGRTYKYITIWAKRVLDTIDLNIIDSQSQEATSASFEDLNARFSTSLLADALGDMDYALRAIRLLQSAYAALEDSDMDFAAKFAMTPERLKSKLDSLSMDLLVMGLKEAENKRHLKNAEPYILQCILEAGEVKPEVQMELPEGEEEISSTQDNELDAYLKAKPSYPELTTRPKRLGEKERNAVRAEIKSKIWYDFIRRQYEDVSVLGTEESSKLALQTLNDFVESLVYVQTTISPCIDMGKKNKLYTTQVRTVLESADLNNKLAMSAIETFLTNYENIRYPDNAKARQKYMLSIIWTEIHQPAQVEEED